METTAGDATPLPLPMLSTSQLAEARTNRDTRYNRDSTGQPPLPQCCGLQALKSQKLSDFVIICKNVRFQTHKLVLYTRSAYFRTLIDSSFAEARTNEVDLKEVEPLAFGSLLVLLYGGKGCHWLDLVYDIYPDLKVRPKKQDEVFLESNEMVKDKFRSYDMFHMILEGLVLVDVYALADRLFLDDIVLAVAHYIIWYIETIIGSPKNLPILTRTLTRIYNATAIDDLKLRARITALCAKHYDCLQTMPAARDIVTERDKHAFQTAMSLRSHLRECHKQTTSVYWEREENGSRSTNKAIKEARENRADSGQALKSSFHGLGTHNPCASRCWSLAI